MGLLLGPDLLAAACTQGKRTQHGKPLCVIRDDQPDAREGQAGAHWGGGEARSVCLTADVSGGLKSHSARGPGLISKGGGNASLAEDDGKHEPPDIELDKTAVEHN